MDKAKIEELRKLKTLLNEGIITKEEFAEARTRLLNCDVPYSDSRVDVVADNSLQESDTITTTNTDNDFDHNEAADSSINGELNKTTKKSNKKIIIGVVAVIAFAIAIATAVVLSEEGSILNPIDETLETYIEKDPETKAEIELAAEDEDLSVTVIGNSIYYNYDLSLIDGMTEELANSEEMYDYFDEAITAESDTFTGLCKDLEEETGIYGIALYIKYLYKEDTMVYWTKFTSAGKEF